jgi:DNA (cytosine-5)-methyltransferase 1
MADVHRTPVYYNEHDPFAAAWLRELIAGGHIPDGYVDERDIQDVQPGDLAGFQQCHFFAGIGGWAYALELAAWGDRPVWTGSCPCQPYSAASVGDGGAKGPGDPRDVWPAFERLIRECEPPVVLGEQVAGAIAWGWWDRAALGMEGKGYACAAAVLRADVYGADHQRRRLFWVADTGRAGREGYQPERVLSVGSSASCAIAGDPMAIARRAMAGDHGALLRSDGLPVTVERARTKGYGNAIVPQVAAEFIRAFVDVRTGPPSRTEVR